jgi:hypothetical protein
LWSSDAPKRYVPAAGAMKRFRLNAGSSWEDSDLKMAGGGRHQRRAMTRAADRWRAIRFTDFERRQIAAVRQDLDQEYEVQIDHPRRRPSVPESPARFPSSSRP